MKKRNLIIISSVITVLVIVVAITAFLNMADAESKKNQQDKAFIIFKKNGEEITTADMESIKKAGEVEFTAYLDTSDTDPESHIYTGVPLIKILDSLDTDLTGIETVIVRGLDGYTVAFDADEVRDENNIYVSYKIDGQYLKTKDMGGSGPYQIIVRKDPYSQRWCKFIMEIDLR